MRRGTPILLALLATAALAGCGLFTPAEPERAIAFEGLEPTYALPESTLLTIARCIEGKGAGNTALNVDAYADAFAQAARGDGAEYDADFDPLDVALSSNFPPIADQWSLARERIFFSHLAAVDPAEYRMRWFPEPQRPDDPQANPHTLHRRYELHAYPPSSDSVLIAVGYCDLEFRQGSAGRWVISKWNDRVDPAVGSPPQNTNNRSIGYRRLESGS